MKISLFRMLRKLSSRLELFQLRILRVTFLFLIAGWCTDLGAQAPDGFLYQTVWRDPAGTIYTPESLGSLGNYLGIEFSVIQGSAVGSAVYIERHDSVAIGVDGLISINFGLNPDTVLSGDLSAIDWGEGPYFLGVAFGNPGFPDGFPVFPLGVSQMLSVPYAYYAGSADSVRVEVSQEGDTLFIGKGYVNIPGISAIAFPPPAYREGYVHCLPNGGVTPIVEVKSQTDRIWMDRNLGAAAIPTSSTDSDGYGSLFQWGRFAEGHQCRASDNYGTWGQYATTTEPNAGNPWDGKFFGNGDSKWFNVDSIGLVQWQGVDGINNPCPTYFRLPTQAEWEAEYGTWSDKTAAGAFNSPLKLTLAGNRRSDGSLDWVGSRGFYATSSTFGSDSFSRLVLRTDRDAAIGSTFISFGDAVRCIKE